MAGVENPLGLALGLVGRVLTTAGDQFDLRPIRPHLDGFAGLGRGRNQDLRLDSRSRRIGRDGRAAISRTVFDEPGHPLLAKRRDHDGRAPVLETAGRREPFELEVRPAASPRMLHERRAALAHRHRFGDGKGEGRGISPKRAHSRVDVAASDAGQRRDHQRPTLVRTPARLGKRVGPTAARIDVGRRSWGVFVFHFEIHRDRFSAQSATRAAWTHIEWSVRSRALEAISREVSFDLGASSSIP